MSELQATVCACLCIVFVNPFFKKFTASWTEINKKGKIVIFHGIGVPKVILVVGQYTPNRIISEANLVSSDDVLAKRLENTGGSQPTYNHTTWRKNQMSTTTTERTQVTSIQPTYLLLGGEGDHILLRGSPLGNVALAIVFLILTPVGWDRDIEVMTFTISNSWGRESGVFIPS